MSETQVVACEPLVTVISAKSKTLSAKILRRIILLARDRGCPAKCRYNVVVGLYLVDEPGSGRFSLRYDEMGEVLYLKIGTKLPKRYFDHVAYSIIAMVKRGRHWQTRGGEIMEEAYGRPPRPRRPNSYWREKHRERCRRRGTVCYW